MKNPFKRDEFIPADIPKPRGGCVVFLIALAGTAGLAYYGVTGLLAQV